MNKNKSPEKEHSSATILFLCLAVAVYSFSGFFTKLASGYNFFTFPYIACLSGVVVVLGVYAVLWQIALKKIPLNQAYPYRSLSIVYGLAIAFFAFHEVVTWQNLLGACIVVSGLVIMTTGK